MDHHPWLSKDDSNTNNNQKFCLLPGLLASASSPSASEQSFCCNTCAKNLICVALRCFRSPYTTTVFSHPFHFSNQLFREFTWSRNMVLDFILELSFLFKCCLYLSILFFEFYYLAVPALNLIKKHANIQNKNFKAFLCAAFHFSMNIVICQFKKKQELLDQTYKGTNIYHSRVRTLIEICLLHYMFFFIGYWICN